MRYFTADKCAQALSTTLHDGIIVGAQNAPNQCWKSGVYQYRAQRHRRILHNDAQYVHRRVLHAALLFNLGILFQIQNAHLMNLVEPIEMF